VPSLESGPDNIQQEPIIRQTNGQVIRPAARTLWLKIIFFQQVKDRYLPLMLLIARRRRQGGVINNDALQTLQGL
jgi:hypothetical protein